MSAHTPGPWKIVDDTQIEHAAVTEVYEGRPDTRGRWLVIRTEHNAEWEHRFPFTFKARPTTPWPLIRQEG